MTDHSPPGSLANLSQCFQEESAIFVIEENRLQLVPAVHHMRNRPIRLQARFSGYVYSVLNSSKKQEARTDPYGSNGSNGLSEFDRNAEPKRCCTRPLQRAFMHRGHSRAHHAPDGLLIICLLRLEASSFLVVSYPLFRGKTLIANARAMPPNTRRLIVPGSGTTCTST